MKQVTCVGDGLIGETPAVIAAGIGAAASMEARAARAPRQGGALGLSIGGARHAARLKEAWLASCAKAHPSDPVANDFFLQQDESAGQTQG